MSNVRQAKLKLECAEFYPTLPVLMWTAAARLAQLVGTYRRAPPQRPGRPERERTLSEADFEFRGGFPHWSAESVAFTRAGESAFA